jgi:DNA-binding response OmpR family regulator
MVEMSEADGMGARILVVEDNDMLLALLRRALVRAGYELIAAQPGAQMMKELYGESVSWWPLAHP